jgi:hypothetical protein
MGVNVHCGGYGGKCALWGGGVNVHCGVGGDKSALWEIYVHYSLHMETRDGWECTVKSVLFFEV